MDPAETEALQSLEDGTRKLEEGLHRKRVSLMPQTPDIQFGPSPFTKGDAEAALALYQRSVNIKRTASSLFNLGVAHYHLSTFDFFACPTRVFFDDIRILNIGLN